DRIRAFEAVRSKQEITRGQVYNVGGGQANATAVRELMGQSEKLMGRKVDYVKDEARPGDQLVYVTDFSKLRSDTGWKPQVSVRETLMRIQTWWKQNRDLFEPAIHDSEPVVTTALQNVP